MEETTDLLNNKLEEGDSIDLSNNSDNDRQIFMNRLRILVSLKYKIGRLKLFIIVLWGFYIFGLIYCSRFQYVEFGFGTLIRNILVGIL